MLGKLMVFGLSIVGGLMANRMWYERKRNKEREVLTKEVGKWESEGGNVPEVPTPGPHDRREYAS